jgi:Cof subfamily protein (haloacid dehalogenase superfamily)
MLVAVDLDGTLIGDSLAISAADAAAVAAACDNGYHICLASGRLFAASRPYAQQLGLRGPIIALQGAVAYEVDSAQRLFCTPLLARTALEAFDYLKDRGFHMQLYYGDQLYLDVLNEWAHYYLKLSRVDPVMVPSLRDLLTLAPPAEPGPIKVLAIANPQAVSATIPGLATLMGKRANVFRSLPPFLEVTDPNANKGYALRRIAEFLGVDMRDTAAIGDADNDIPMFEAAAQSFAVANGSDAARRTAQTIVPAQGEGVAYALGLLQSGGPATHRIASSEEEQAHEPA